MTRRELRASEVERDTRLESRYSFDHKGARSVLAFVTEHLVELAEEFATWWADHAEEREKAKALARFEAKRFGELLYPAAHGVLAAAVRDVEPPPERTLWMPFKD